MSESHPLKESSTELTLSNYWNSQILEIQQAHFDWKTHPLPLARIKKVMKTDPDVRVNED